jgi:transcriptional regulator with XRE-family HTH domain
MDKRSVTGRSLSERLEVSKTTVSKILTGKARPKQDTFSEICVALCHTDEERNSLIEAYTGVRPSSALSMEKPTPLEEQYPARQKNAETLLQERCAQWPFAKEVSIQLHEWGLRVEAQYVKGAVATDFLVDHNGRKIALECRTDFEACDIKMECLLIKAILKSKAVDEAYIVLPDSGEYQEATLNDGVRFFALSRLKAHLFDQTQ